MTRAQGVCYIIVMDKETTKKEGKTMKSARLIYKRNGTYDLRLAVDGVPTTFNFSSMKSVFAKLDSESATIDYWRTEK